MKVKKLQNKSEGIVQKVIKLDGFNSKDHIEEAKVSNFYSNISIGIDLVV